MMPELDVERVPIFRKVRLAPVRAIVIDLQRGVRVFTEPAPPLTEKIPARKLGVLLHGLAVRRAVGGNDRALSGPAVVVISLDRDMVPLPRIGVRPESGVPQVPAVVVVRVLVELRVVIGESTVGPEGHAARRLASKPARRQDPVFVPAADRSVRGLRSLGA